MDRKATAGALLIIGFILIATVVGHFLGLWGFLALCGIKALWFGWRL